MTLHGVILAFALPLGCRLSFQGQVIQQKRAVEVKHLLVACSVSQVVTLPVFG
jgi:hypothetical protein